MPKMHIALLGAVLACAPLAAAPYLVKDLNLGPGDPNGFYYPLATAGRVLYFGGTDPAHGTELWRSDGTAAGTYRLTDVCAGRCGSSPFEVVPWRGQVYFTADDVVSGRELWRTDGVPGHEPRVGDLRRGPRARSPGGLVPASAYPLV